MVIGREEIFGFRGGVSIRIRWDWFWWPLEFRHCVIHHLSDSSCTIRSANRQNSEPNFIAELLHSSLPFSSVFASNRFDYFYSFLRLLHLHKLNEIKLKNILLLKIYFYSKNSFRKRNPFCLRCFPSERIQIRHFGFFPSQIRFISIFFSRFFFSPFLQCFCK